MSEKQVKITSDLSIQGNNLKDAKIDAQDNVITNLDTSNLATGVLRQIASQNPSEDKLLSEAGVQHSIDVAVSGFNSMIQQGLADEKQERTNVDAAIRAELAQEATTRESADNTIIANVEAEVGARTSEDARLTTLINRNASSISAEQINRTNADNALQEQIDTLSGLSNGVVAIVGTYADLESYDTSKLHNGDIIEVLQDEEQDNKTTYYEYSKTGDTFTLIGSVASSYTKAEANATFVPQTRTVNGKALSSDITLNASDVNALPDSTDLTDLVTPAQAAALNSGIDSDKVGQIASNTTSIAGLNTRVESTENSVISLGNRVGSVESSVSTLATSMQPMLGPSNAGANIEIKGTGENVKIVARIDNYEVEWNDIVGNPYDNEHFNEVMHTKQDVLTAGNGIIIENNTISAANILTAGEGIVIENDVISATNILTAGNGIIIDNNVISVNPEIFPKSEYNKYTLTLLAGTTNISTGIDLSMKASNVFLNGIYQTINRDYTLTTINGNTHIVFTNTLAENAIVDLEVFDLNLYQGSSNTDQPITILPNNQSSYSFNTNTINQFTLNANVSAVTFSLPVPQNTTISNSILIHTYIGNASINVNWGTSKFFNNETPSIDTYGYYDILYVYNNLLNAWVCKVTFIVEEQRIDYKNYIVDVALDYDNYQVIPDFNELIAVAGNDVETFQESYIPTIGAGGTATFTFNNLIENEYNWAYIQYLGNEEYEAEQTNIILEQTDNVTFELTPKIKLVNTQIYVNAIDQNNAMVLMGDPIYAELYQNQVILSNTALYGDSGGQYHILYELLENSEYTLNVNFYGNLDYENSAIAITFYPTNDPIYTNLILEETNQVTQYVLNAEDYGYSTYWDDWSQQYVTSFGTIKEQVPGAVFIASDNSGDPYYSNSVLVVSKYNSVVNNSNNSIYDNNGTIYYDCSMLDLGNGMPEVIVEAPEGYNVSLLGCGVYTNSTPAIYYNEILMTTPFTDSDYQYNLVTLTDLSNYGIIIHQNGILDLPYNNGSMRMLPDNSVLENAIIYINDTNTANYEIDGVMYYSAEYNLVGPNTKVQMVNPIVMTGIYNECTMIVDYNDNKVIFGQFSTTSLCSPTIDAAAGIRIDNNAKLTTKLGTFYQQGNDTMNIIINYGGSWRSYQDTFQHTRITMGNNVIFTLAEGIFVEQNNSMYDFLISSNYDTNGIVLSLYDMILKTVDDGMYIPITVENYNSILRPESYLQRVTIFINGEMVQDGSIL